MLDEVPGGLDADGVQVVVVASNEHRRTVRRERGGRIDTATRSKCPFLRPRDRVDGVQVVVASNEHRRTV